MNGNDRGLIVGAGPVGLGAALFLAQQGPLPRIVEMRDEPSRQSKALAVNPRTLEILKPTGVAERMLELGIRIRGARISRAGRLLANLSLEGIHREFPFMLALSQAATERLLAQALEASGGTIERGIKLTGCRALADGVEAELAPTAGGDVDRIRCPWLLAADGARSTVREQLHVNFPGSALAGQWHLADAPLRTRLAEDHAHIIFLEEGAFLFMLRVVDPALEQSPGAPLWRVLTNRPDPLSRLVEAEQAGPPIWTSAFHVPHRINAELASGTAFFAGDAAHLHSPVGARGMNLGLEDAWVFAALMKANRLSDYDRLRRPVDAAVVRRVELISKIVSGESLLYRWLRRFLFPIVVKLAPVRRHMVQTVAGLDHDLPAISAARS